MYTIKMPYLGKVMEKPSSVLVTCFQFVFFQIVVTEM